METLMNWLANAAFFTALPAWVAATGTLVVFLILGYTGAPLWVWAIAGAAALIGADAGQGIWIAFGVLVALFNLPFLRRSLLSGPLMKLMDALKFLPTISDTEQTAIEAGTVWMEGELFSGKPDFRRVMRETYPELTQEEQAFLDGPVEEVCASVSDWEVFQTKDLDPKTWDLLRKHRFFGLVIPKEYGGHGFSANAHSAIVAKLGSRCGPLATTVMVPNSLGPAELLIHYGTKAQKDHYLPKLATGDEMPCFALTENNAGSDAGGMESGGVVFRGEDGELYVRLNWDKRYITLAAIASVLGLAFKLRDPENLLGKGTEPGITCALIPAKTKGVVLGRRHDPLGVPFYNCPTRGHDVVIPVDSIIGGPQQAGNGWRMLMESLAVGRGISLPAQASGGAKMAVRAVGAYSAIRKQFGLNIGRFEGIEEPLARIGGYSYLMEAGRRFICGGLDQGAKPAVVTAIAKYNFTELGRKIVNDAMDVVGGAGISRGPRNLIAHNYIATPIAITVEGANILTRTLMIFGQGAIRCHPFAFKEINALMTKDVAGFDQAFWRHIGHVVRNMVRSLVLSLTRGSFAGTGGVRGPAAGYVRRMTWVSASFAFLADLALGSYGGSLKMKEKIAGRYADILSWMVLGTATIRRFEAEGRRKEDRAFFDWSMKYSFARIQEAFDGIYSEIRVPGLSWLFRGPIALWSRINRFGAAPSDDLGHQVAQAMQMTGDLRDRMTEGIYVPSDPTEALGRLEYTMSLLEKSAVHYKALARAVRERKIKKGPVLSQLDAAVEAGVLTKDQAQQVRDAEKARFDAILVDEFTLEEYKALAGSPVGGGGVDEVYFGEDGLAVQSNGRSSAKTSSTELEMA